MRHTIETAPRNGKVVILDDESRGIYDVAHWSAEARDWVSENGEPTKITPSHWYPMQEEQYSRQEQDISSGPSASPVRRPRLRQRFATSSIAAALVGAALVGVYFRAEVAAFVTRYASQQDIFRVSAIVGQQILSRTQNLRQAEGLTPQQLAETDRTPTGQEVKQAEKTSVPESRQLMQTEQRTEDLANELADARRVIDGLNLQLRAGAANSAQVLEQEREAAAAARQELTASMEQNRQALEEERAHSAALAGDLARAHREIETQLAQSSKTDDEAAYLKEAAESATAELRQSLQQEHDRAESLASELATARHDLEAQVVLSSKTHDEAAHVKKTAESAAAELRQSLRQEHDRAETLARDLESVRHQIDARITVDHAPDGQKTQVVPAAEAPATEQPAAGATQGNADAAKLIARASALLGQGNISAARIVLERAAETGNARASFMLAETYDPNVLSAWGTYGTRGEATKARELYAKAQAGGIREAKDRFNALSQ